MKRLTHKLTPEDVIRIKQARIDGVPVGEVANWFEVSKRTIWNIWAGDSHRDVGTQNSYISEDEIKAKADESLENLLATGILDKPKTDEEIARELGIELATYLKVKEMGGGNFG